MNDPIIGQTLLFAACIVVGFVAMLALIASARTGYFIARTAIRHSRRMRNA